MIKKAIAFITLWTVVQALAVQPSKDGLAACQSGRSQGSAKVVGIPFDAIEHDDDYWRGFSANTTSFREKSLGYAKKGEAQGIAFNHRVYPIDKAQLINISAADYRDQLERGTLELGQPSDWYWLSDKRRRQYVCIVLGGSMEQGTPMIFFLNTSGRHAVYFFLARH